MPKTPPPLSNAVSVIGLTGGIGSGKSTVAARLVERGARLVDTDAIARRLTSPDGAAMPALTAAFGSAAVARDGGLDRGHLRQLAFSDTNAKAMLEQILHPLIDAEARRQSAAAMAEGRTVVCDVPLLTESGHWRARVDRVWVVDCTEATQLARVGRRHGWDIGMAHRVIAQQASRTARRAIADAVIFNDGLDLAALHGQVDALCEGWRTAG